MAMQVLEAADEESAEYLSNFALDLDTEGLDAEVQEPCIGKHVCIMKCSLIYPGCNQNTFAQIQGTQEGNVPAHYFQHSCMYRWGMNPTSSWIFNLVWGEYQNLVRTQGYPAVGMTNIMQFEKDMYSVCASQKKCAGFGISALGSAYYDFDMECQKTGNHASRTGLQNQLNSRRGTGYGGADSQIQYWDANRSKTYNLLAQARSRMDNIYIDKLYKAHYDFCPCESFNQFHQFVKSSIIPVMQANKYANPQPQWFSGVYAAMGPYMQQWPGSNGFGAQMDNKIQSLKAWCKKQCGK